MGVCAIKISICQFTILSEAIFAVMIKNTCIVFGSESTKVAEALFTLVMDLSLKVYVTVSLHATICYLACAI